MNYLSPNFTVEEFVKSHVAEEKGIINRPTIRDLYNMTELCHHVLEPLLNLIDGKKITITSGFRSPVLNHLIGGVPDSQHLEGKAADIQVEGMTTDALYEKIKANLKFDQLILEKVKGKNWVHVSWDDVLTNRQQAIKIEKKAE